MERRIDLKAATVYIDRLLNGPSNSENSKKAKEDALSVLVEYDGSSYAAKWLRLALELANKELQLLEEGYSSAGYGVVSLRYQLVTPGLVGVGAGLFRSLFEVGLSIDPVLGLPYYPGSGIKGAVRAITETVLDRKTADLLFGSTGEEGSASAIVFSDMYPIGCTKDRCSIFRGLVVTPHYHYQGKPVANELVAMPVPVQHIGIEEGTVFGLVIAIHPIRAKHVVARLKLLDCEPVPESLRELCSLIKTRASSVSDPIHSVALTSILLLDSVLAYGIASRSTKGYNIFEPSSGPHAEFTLLGYRYKYHQGKLQRQRSSSMQRRHRNEYPRRRNFRRRYR
ncbi:type III-B CRISPR module RAMP protein Cmr6 [Pyrodictium abyssi]|uniref:type III-B CRISPR module RAMP protein Cmr6 n=1 Tax=Pyrodictium abyssi TaxID=54256 RepID=UPI0030C72BAC